MIVVEALLVCLLVGLGWWAGGRLAGPWRWPVLGCCLVAVILIALARRVPDLGFGPLAPLLYADRGRFLEALAIPLLLVGLGRLLKRKRELALIRLLILIAVLSRVVAPALSPVVLLPAYAVIVDEQDEVGVSLQDTTFTCGPAAAHTALRAIGVNSSVRALAEAGRTNPFTGTSPGMLMAAIDRIDLPDDLDIELRRIADPGDLPEDRPVIMVIDIGIAADHWVAMLGRGADGRWLMGDPYAGLIRLNDAQLKGRWVGDAIVLDRPGRRFVAGDTIRQRLGSSSTGP